MHSPAKTDNVINVRITHKTARVPLLESIAFKDKKQALIEIRSLENVEECLILQTCNRIELFIVTENGQDTVNLAKDYLAKGTIAMTGEAHKAIETSLNHDAINHLLRITSGLESMVIGEDQVTNQVWDAYLEAESAKTSGPILKYLFNRAITIGRRVRNETDISKGAVSIGSAAVELAAKLLGDLHQKKILVMGAGETGTLVAKALARRCLNPIFIANRTYDRAVKLAEELAGKAVRFDQFDNVLVDADVVICATSAPHYLITKDNISKIINQRANMNELLIVDISNPRNVEKTVQEITKLRLYTIDDLQFIAEKNKRERQKSVDKAIKIIDDELFVIEREMKSHSVRLIISSLLSHVEEIRQRELAKALNMLGNVDEKERQIVEDLTNILLKQTFLPIVENLRLAAMNGDKQLVDQAIKLFEKMENNYT